MPRTCRVCESPHLEAIDARIAAGDPIPPIAREFGLPASNVYRHRNGHMGIVKAISQSRPASALATVERLELLDGHLDEVFKIAVRRSSAQAAVDALTQRVRIALEVAALRDEIKPKKSVNPNKDIDKETAARIAGSHIRHEQFTGVDDNGE